MDRRGRQCEERFITCSDKLTVKLKSFIISAWILRGIFSHWTYEKVSKHFAAIKHLWPNLQESRIKLRVFKVAKSSRRLWALVHLASIKAPLCMQQAQQAFRMRPCRSWVGGEAGTGVLQDPLRNTTEKNVYGLVADQRSEEGVGWESTNGKIMAFRSWWGRRNRANEFSGQKHTSDKIWHKYIIPKHWVIIIPRCSFHPFCVPLMEKDGRYSLKGLMA